MLGRHLGPYRLEEEIGSGGMGAVYRAQGPEGTVALKVVHPQLAATPEFVQRFLREGEIGRRVRHPNVVATLAVGSDAVDGQSAHWLAMEHVRGQTLRALLEELGLVPEELCRHIGREVAKGLGAIHAAGAVHRDVKPENVLITREHVVKVMDLGVAQVKSALRLSQTGAFVGSVHNAAPEQLRLGPIDGRADLYALGVTLYELATGVHPVTGDELAAVVHAVLHGSPRRAGELNPQLSPFFEETVAKLLEKDPERRFTDAAEVERVLDEGERSGWWRRRASEVRAATLRPLRRIRIPRETALHGRDADLAHLRAMFDSAKAGEGRVVLVEGEAGIGKSRLVDEFVASLRTQGEDVNFLFGGWPPGGAATASGAFSTAYREHFGEEGLEETLRAALPQTPLLVPAFAALLRGDATPKGAEPLTKDSLQTVFVRASQALAAERPTIVLVEDLHFAPEEGRALFAALAHAAPGARLLLIGTSRPGIDENWVASLQRAGAASRLPVSRLGPRDLARLLTDALRSEHLAEELAGRIGAKSDGNPYFVFEILRDLRDGRWLTQRADGAWVTTQRIVEIRIPDTIRDLVEGRVSDLSPESRELLQVAACCGFEFDPLLVGEVLSLDRFTLLRALGTIEKTHRLVRSVGRRFAFDHHQVQEVLYSGLSDLHRESYHAAIGAAMERRSGAAGSDVPSLDGALCVDLAHHFLQGGDGARGLRYVDAALTHLEKRYLNEAAVRLASAALAAQPAVSGGGRVELLLRKADRLDYLGRREEQRAALDEALSAADALEEPVLRVRCRVQAGWHLVGVSQVAEAAACLGEALDIAASVGDLRGEAAARAYLGLITKDLGRPEESRAHHERSFALATALGDRTLQARSIGNLAILDASIGRYAEARRQCAAQLAIALDVGDLRGAANAVGNDGTVSMWLGEFERARRGLERQLEIARQIGERRGEMLATGNLGNLCYVVGRLADSRSYIERLTVLAAEIGDVLGAARAQGALGNVQTYLGLPEEAIRLQCAYLAETRRLGDRRMEGFALQDLAYALEAAGRPEDALRRMTEALELRRETGQRDGEAASLVFRGGVLARLGRQDEARPDLEAALALGRELSIPYVEVTAAAALALLPGGDRAAALAAHAAHAERLDARSAMEARLLLWEATGDRTHLDDAKRRLDELVAYAPPDCRASMLANVRLHREIAQAAAKLPR